MRRALGICAAPGCSTPVIKGRCVRHAKPAFSGKTGGPAYDAEYRHNRSVVLARDPSCTIRTHCSGDVSTQVDHIHPQGGNGLDNLRGACATCNHRRGSALGGKAA